MTGALSNSPAWAILLVAGGLEIVWAVSMKASDGFTKLHYATLTMTSALLSFYLLGLSLKTLPVGTAYAVWTGIGVVGVAVLGILLFKEPASAVRISCILLIVMGILGLRLTGSE